MSKSNLSIHITCLQFSATGLSPRSIQASALYVMFVSLRNFHSNLFFALLQELCLRYVLHSFHSFHEIRIEHVYNVHRIEREAKEKGTKRELNTIFAIHGEYMVNIRVQQ